MNVEDMLVDIDVSEAVIHRTLLSLDNSASMGPDRIPAVLLKKCADTFAPALAKLFRHSLDTANLADSWRHTLVTPIFKKGDRKLPGNYRPVSLTSTTCWKDLLWITS